MRWFARGSGAMRSGAMRSGAMRSGRPEVRIRINTNVTMSRHKAAAQAVHAALAAFGIEHGRVVVLGGRPDEVRAMDVVVHDAGRTEVDPGTLTAGASLVRPEHRED